MAIFEIETPQGKFEVDAPTMDAAVQALGGSKQPWWERDYETGSIPGDVGTQSKDPAAQEFAKFASGATQNPAYAQYEQLPWYQKPLVAANDAVNLVSNGATFGFGDKAVAAMRAPFTDKSYDEELAEQRRQTEGSRKRSGWAGTAAEVTGGIGTGLAALRNGLTATSIAAGVAPGLPRLAALMGTSALDNAAIGGLMAAGNDTNIAKGAGMGALVGGLTPAAFAALRNVFAPIFARMQPDRAANAAIEQMMARSGRTQQQIVDDLNAAAQEGQGGVFTAADALGNPGQRMLSTIARTPGDARTRVVEALEGRQAGQGERVSQFLQEGFGNPVTAAQTETARTLLRRAAGNQNYGAARALARPVDVSAATLALDNILTPGVTRLIGAGANNGGVYSTLARIRGLLGTRGAQVSDFDRAFMAKTEMDAVIEQGGSAAALLRPARNALDDALSRASAPYAGARDAYRQASRSIEAVDTGRQAATRGRYEDTIPAFRGMDAGEQSGFRAGYADPLIERAQRSATGVNKARPLITPKTAQEFPTFAAPGRGGRLQRQIGREQRMFETRNQALGGSRTADNLADQAELALSDPSILGNLLTMNWGAAAGAIGRQSIANIQGLSPSVRARLADFLLSRSGTDVTRRLSNSIRQGRRLTQREMAHLRMLLISGTTAANSSTQRTQ